MTTSAEKRFFVISLAVLMLSILFYLEEGGKPGWKSGVSLLMLSIFCCIDVARSSNKFFRVIFSVFSLFFFVLSFKNFLGL